MNLTKIKRPAGTYLFELDLEREDEHGFWVSGRPGQACVWPDGHRDPLHHPMILLITPGRPWVGWWLLRDDGRRLSLDICTPPQRTADGWSIVDLELDPLWTERDGQVQIEDEDEYRNAVREGWMTSADANLARAAADEGATILRVGTEPWIQAGWDLLIERFPS
ncbi:ribonuclease FAU-1 family protein [Kineosporia succinea]|uniref:DUF402 domain-containing protein n=1 Tax=Kineosporia succinea TaxID=84632 RepID=A0ABT9P527_9ACTN|nr:DUF402 domain-containing protein [Kineosporia succinea]MDP9827656.1 hypothetical protein [Kineosporia succinea]